MDDVAILLLAGGRARRFPRKLEHRIAGRPMLEHVYARVRECGWPVYIAGSASFERKLDAALEAPLIIDRRPSEGPLSALIGACAAIRADRIFAIAADQPQLDANVLRRLAQQWQPGDEAVVPEHDGEIEPLAALYSRRAALRESFALRRSGRPAMRDLVGRLAARFVPAAAAYFHNVNRARDLAEMESGT
jgi:molybdopterin-guanine dinucleotide biosynthesis protein A